MGCCFSRRSSSSRVENIIRVVHLNGSVQNFEYPVTVSEVIGRSPKLLLCTPSQLISNCSKGLLPDTVLETGHIYFLLPYSALQSDVSPVDLASIARKLTAKAKSTKCKAESSPVWKSPARSPNQISQPDSGLMPCGAQRFSRVRPWKPILDTIREKSFNRRSESDLQET
ncbi:hypothetical protein PTKIN_Ptkin03bG0128300 [Pterospermum kingtungense]